MPKADFTFTIANPGLLPANVDFVSTSGNATTLKWSFDNGMTSTEENPQTMYPETGTYNVKLIASNPYGVDSIVKKVVISVDKPAPDFSFRIRNQGCLPDTVDFFSTSAMLNQ